MTIITATCMECGDVFNWQPDMPDVLVCPICTADILRTANIGCPICVNPAFSGPWPLALLCHVHRREFVEVREEKRDLEWPRNGEVDDYEKI